MPRPMMWSTVTTLALLILAAPTFAGGWAVVTLDTLLTDVQAEQTIRLSFMVRQHGDTPIDVHTWSNEMPSFFGTNTETGEAIRFEARKEGGLGHYVADVTFPSAGSWTMEIVPAPFAGTELGTLTVLPATGTRSGQAGLNDWLIQPATLRIIGGALLLIAICLALFRQRTVARRRLALRSQ